MKIGILKETGTEKRVALLPDCTKALEKMNMSVMVESRAGEFAFSTDADYEATGAIITNRQDIIENTGLIIMIQPPSDSDLEIIPEGKILVALLNPFFNLSLVKKLAEKNITSFSMELIPRITMGQTMDVLSSQATVSGYKAVLDAAVHLPHFMPMFMTAAGTIKPAKVLILGAGVAGLQAVATARRLGAVVEVFDVRSAVKEEVKSLGAGFVEVEGAKEDSSAGGYAIEQDLDFKKRQAQAIHDRASRSNVIICTAQIPGKKAPVLIKKETVEVMAPGSVIVDLASSSGGNCELTRDGQTIVHNRVSIIGKSDYPSDMPFDSSRLLGRNIVNFLKRIINRDGTLNLNFEDEIVRGTCLTHNKEVVHQRIKEMLMEDLAGVKKNKTP
jgi:H+-translocating NAD(P) transhydrogenase subunit alpha